MRVLLCLCSLALLAGCTRPAPRTSNHPTIDQFLAKRWRGPGGLPADRYRAAAARIRGMPAFAVAASGAWEPLGPVNVGGRTKALVIDPINPATMYAGAATGGVWKTTDAGNSWFPLTDHLPTLAVNSLVMDPSNNNTLYVGTGEVIPGQGIFKTTDGGQTWTQLQGTAGFAYVYSLAISSSRPGNIYAGTDSGVWSSVDGGANWTQSYATGSCFSVAVRGDQPSDVVFAACTPQPGSPLAYFPQDPEISGGFASYAIYQDSDGSPGNWTFVFSAVEMGPTVLAIAPSAPNTIYALAADNNSNSAFANALAGLYASDQGGGAGTWQQRASTSDAASYTANILSYPQYDQGCSYGTSQGHRGQGSWNLGLAVDPTNSQVVFTAGPQLSRSTDGGRTFSGLSTTSNLFFHTDFHAFAFHPNYDGAANQTLFATLDGGVYRSDVARTNSGFKACGSDQYYNLTGGAMINGLQIAQFYSGAVAPGGAGYLGGTQDTCSMVSVPGQTSWKVIYNGDGGMTAFDPSDPQTFYVASTAAPSNPPLLKSTDGGQSLKWAAGGITAGSGNGVFNGLAVDPNNPLTVYYGLGALWRSQDGAGSWTVISPLTGAPIAAIGVNPFHSAEVIFGNNNGFVFHGSADAWTSVQPRSGYVSSFAFDPSHDGVIYATYSTFRSQATDSQIYVSKDHGATWSALGIGSLPDIPVHVLIVDPESAATLYIGTDMGVFVSFDSGSTWAHDSSLPSVITESLVLDAVPGVGGRIGSLYAFTHGRGAWKVRLRGRGIPR